jgi:two-component system LytT family sensor kinase
MNSSAVPPPRRYYWRTQLLGWGCYAVFNLILFRVFAPKMVAVWSGFFSFILGGVLLGASHLLRWLVLRLGWLEKPPLPLLARLLLTNAGLAVGSEVLIGLLARTLLPTPTTGGPQGWGQYVGYTINMNIMLWLWTAAYLGWHYLQRSQRAEVEKWQLTAAVREAELNTLRAQLNPHFLFNGLNNIRALVSEDPTRARQALAHLAELLRYVMQHSATTLVPLQQEMEIVADYLALEALQLEDRLHYALDVDPGATSVQLPPLTVQLLVENAIKHGVSARAAGGFVQVAAQLDEAGFLHLTVRSTGQFSPPAPGAGGLGLRTLCERLSQVFGAEARFEVGNDPAASDTVRATLRLPAGRPNGRPAVSASVTPQLLRSA